MSDADLQERIARLSPEKRALLELRLLSGQRAASYQAIPARASRGRFPMSFAQQRLWILDQIDPAGSLPYHLPRALRIKGSLDVEALQRTLDAIVQRHEVLRTTFVYAGDSPVQVVNQPVRVEMPIVDLSKRGRAQGESELQRLLAYKSRLRFDLSTDLMLRATLFKLAENDHVFLIVTHHIASDAWSRGVLFGEMSALYDAFTSGRASQLPDLPIQYGDFACWQRERLQGEALNAQLDYWKRQLSGVPALLELPTDRPRPPVMTFRGARQAFTISADLCEQLKALSRRHQTTLFMTLLAVFQTLLYRYTGQEDIAVGTPIANRGRVEIEPLIGFLLNTLVLRTDLSGNPSFSELLGRVREVALDGYANQDIPFERLVEELRPERDLSRNPLFQVMFILQNAPSQALDLSGLAVAPVEVDAGTAQFDLRMTTQESDGGLSASLEYSSDLFDDATITRMIGHFQSLLEGIATDPNQRIGHLPMLTRAERLQLAQWNDTATEYPYDACLHHLFEAQVERNPDAVAVVSDGATLTYRDLNRRANRLAYRLRATGVGPEVAVGIFLERSLDMVVGTLGILKAGGAYLPLDPAYPAERLEYMLRDAHVPVVLTHSHLYEALPETADHVVCMDTDSRDIGVESDANPSSMGGAENLAYVIYTSGSTGRPKGVQVTHKALANCLRSFAEEPGVSEADTLLAVTTLSFDIATLELFLPLMVGARLVIASREEASDGAALVDKLATSCATVMQATPATWRMLFLAGWQGDSGLKILCGGDSLPRDLADRLLATGAQVWNLYGPTETTIWSAIHKVEPGDGPVPIGRPIANTLMHILDANLQPIPVGVPGHIYIGGDGLARGYLDQPEMTHERFIPDPFDVSSASLVYMTGDLGKYLADGSIQYLGRTDNQVKVRGFRVELGEVEAALRQHPTVREAVAITQDDASGSKLLSAYVVLRRSMAARTRDLREFLGATLPGYMVPSSLMILDALPVTPNGKVDRRALPDARKRDDVEHGYVAPRDDLERQLAGIWERVLELPRVGIADNFFDLGGHSLLGARLFAQIEKGMGAKLPLATLFQSPSIEQLAALLRNGESASKHSSLVPIHERGSRPPFFMVHGGDGYILGFRNLAPYLGEDQPFYGLEAQGCDGTAEPLPSFEAMAAHYIEQIRTVQTEGPYHLGGFCLGGKIALEMAQQLLAQGQEVGLLVFMDTPRSDGLRLVEKAVRRMQRRVYLGKRAFLLLRRLRVIAPRDSIRQIRYSLEKNRFLRTAEVREVNYSASRRYIPRVYPGRITHIVSEQHVIYSRDDRIGWGDIAAEGVEICHMPGQEEDMLKEPNVAILAQHLTASLENSRGLSAVKQV